MLNPQLIKSFLSRKLNSYDWMKGESRPELEAAINELVPKPALVGLWDHQLVCFLLIEAFRRFMLFIDMGGGKTLITLSTIRYRKHRGELPKAIVFVPYITSIETWIDEVARHTPDLRCVPLYGTTNENLYKLATEEGDLFVICYQSAVAMLAGKRPNKRTGKSEWYLNAQDTRDVFANFDMLVMDEIHRCKSATSLTYYMCRAISAQCDWVLGLTGTPFGRDLQDLWPQFNLIDFGETLGDTFGLYREAFFNKKEKYWGGYEFKFKKELFNKLQAVIKNNSIRYSVDEFADMPPAIPFIKRVKPHEGIEAYAKRASAELNKHIAGGKLKEAESEYLKLRQLASGFMTLHGEDTTKVHVKFDENPKLDALQELVEDMPAGCKMVVFHHFVYTNTLISDRLKTMKVKHARIYGKSKDPIKELQRFKTDDSCTILVINGKSGSSSLNLQIANYCIFFEQLDSAIDRQQAERRVYRPGQTKRVFFGDLLMTGTADFGIRQSNQEGKNLLQSLFNEKAEV
jgi:SNF2 family DNA or RNA helicase